MKSIRKSRCLICYTDVSAKASVQVQKSSLVSKHLHVIFILRHLFELPSRQLSEYLKNCPNVENWIICCEKCTNLIENCKLIYNDLLLYTTKFRATKQSIIEIAKKSLKDYNDFSNKCKAKNTRDIIDECRSFINKYEYTNLSNPFTEGDAKAQELTCGNKWNQFGILPLLLSQSGSEITFTPEEVCVKKEIEHLENFEDDAEWVPPFETEQFKESLDDVDVKFENEDYEPRKPLRVAANKSRPKKNSRTKCAICRKTYYDTPTMVRHQARVHGIGTFKTIPCEVEGCGQLLAGPYKFRLHMARHEKNPRFKCQICGKGIYEQSALIRHEEMHQMKKDKPTGPHQCDICLKGFFKKKNLSDHKRRIHVNKAIKRANEQIGMPEDDSKTTVPTFSKATDERLHNYKGSSGLDKPFGPVSRDLTFEPDPHAHTEKESDKKTLQSETKNRKARSKRAHKTGTKNILRCKCPICDKVYHDKSTMTRHQARVHGIGVFKMVPCEFEGCGKLLAGPYKLRLHIATMHEKNPQFKCQYCEKGFYERHVLRYHERKHAISQDKDTLRFQCDLCHKIYSHLRPLNNHKRLVHKVDEHNMPFEAVPVILCSEDNCKAAVSSCKELELHFETNHKEKNQLLCSECGQGFYTKQAMAKHIGRHQREKKGKPFTCEFCGSLFDSHCRLKYHKRDTLRCKLLYQDKVEASIVCQLCGGTFASQKNLDKHITRAHTVQE